MGASCLAPGLDVRGRRRDPGELRLVGRPGQFESLVRRVAVLIFRLASVTHADPLRRSISDRGRGSRPGTARTSGLLRNCRSAIDQLRVRNDRGVTSRERPAILVVYPDVGVAEGQGEGLTVMRALLCRLGEDNSDIPETLSGKQAQIERVQRHAL